MIEKLVVKNFKCFKNAEIPFKPLTVVCGGNGVGKSSMIQSLLVLRQAADQLQKLDDVGVLAVDKEVGFPVKLNGPYKLSLGNSGRLTNDELEHGDILIEVHSASHSATPVSLSFHADVHDPKVTIQAAYRGGVTSEIFKKSGELPIFSDEFHYLIAERNGPRDLSDVSAETYIATGMAGEHTADAIERGDKQNRQVHEKLCISDGSNLFKWQLEAWMRLLVPNLQLFSHPYPEISRVRLSVEKAGTPVGPLSLTSTGFGISYVLPVVVSGLLCPPGAMLIVENPEAHLHPAAQSAVGQFLAAVSSTGVQVIIETHSENVINGVRLAALNDMVDFNDVGMIFFSSKDGDTQPVLESISMDALAELSAWPRGFFDQQGNDLASLMKERKAKRALMEAKA